MRLRHPCHDQLTAAIIGCLLNSVITASQDHLHNSLLRRRVLLKVFANHLWYSRNRRLRKLYFRKTVLKSTRESFAFRSSLNLCIKVSVLVIKKRLKCLLHYVSGKVKCLERIVYISFNFFSKGWSPKNSHDFVFGGCCWSNRCAPTH